jgi:hypothetical protein
MQMDRKNELARRSFLKAISLGIAAPLAFRASRLAIAAPGPRPLRMLFFYIPHGMPMEHFNPMGTPDNFTFTMTGESVLAPLEPYKRYVNIMRGLEYKGINNHPAIRWTLTGNENAAISIDRAIAKGMNTQPVSLGVIPFQNYWGSDMYLVKDGTWIRPEPSPVAAADRIFPPMDGMMMSSDLEFRRSALGLTEREIDRLMKANAALTREQSKLQIHLEAVRSLKSGGMGNTNSCMGQPTLPTVAALRASKANVLETNNLPQVLDGQLELAAQAMICGAARVLTIQNLWATSDVNFGFMGISKNHHDPASHSWDAAGRAEFARIQRYYYQHLVDKLVRTLAMAPDALDTTAPGRMVLDNTLIYVFSEIADGADHNSNKGTVWLNGKPNTSYIPLLTIGGGAGAIKTGRIFDFENRSHGDLLYTLSEIAGVPQSGFGTSIAEVKA